MYPFHFSQPFFFCDTNKYQPLRGRVIDWVGTLSNCTNGLFRRSCRTGNRPYSRRLSHVVSQGGKQKNKIANESSSGRVCLFSKNETTILVMQEGHRFNRRFQSDSSVRASLTRSFQMANCTKFNKTNKKFQELDLPHIAQVTDKAKQMS